VLAQVDVWQRFQDVKRRRHCDFGTLIGQLQRAFLPKLWQASPGGRSLLSQLR
jgi:hypothetical protein